MVVGNDIFIQQCLVTLNNSSQMESTFWPRGRKGKGALESSTEGTAISASKGFEATVEAVSLSSSPCCFARWRTALWKHFDIIQFLNTKNRNKTLEFETIEYNTVLWFQYLNKINKFNFEKWLGGWVVCIFKRNLESVAKKIGYSFVLWTRKY